MAVEKPGSPALLALEDTAGENIPMVEAEPGSCAFDSSLSAPRGVANCEEVVAAFDGGMLVTPQN